MNGFKVTVSLAEIFNDHRRICRMFVNLNRMETINDLHEHIAKTFNLKNFYLMAENQFLPGSENIQILNVNDSISVVPIPQSLSNHLNVENTNVNNPTQQQLIENNISSSENESTENVGKKRRKKNKEKLVPNKKLKDFFTPSNKCLCGSTPVEINDQITNEENETNKTSKKNKTLKRTNLTAKIDGQHDVDVEEDIDENGSHNSVKDKVEYFEKCTDLLNPTQNENNVSLESVNISDVMRNHKLFVKPNDSLKLISTKLPQQQNIIKNIVVSTSKETSECVEDSSIQFKILNGEHDSNTLNDSNQQDVNSSDKINILQNIVIPQEVIEISNNSVSVEVMETEETLTITNTNESQSNSNETQENVTKRKRVRTRKRKSKNVQPEEKTTFTTNFNFKMSIPKASPTIHIKFDDDGNTEDLKNVGSQQVNPEQEEHEDSDQVIFVDCNQTNRDKVPEKGDVEYVPNEKMETEKGDFQNEEKDFLEYLPETIEKYPLLENESLKQGNFIAFKLLKLGDLLIPEMTNYIIGKVMEINNDGKDVTINVVDGLEEAKTAADSLFEGDELLDVTETMRKYERRHLLSARLISKNSD